jgi:hypothetical protein
LFQSESPHNAAAGATASLENRLAEYGMEESDDAYGDDESDAWRLTRQVKDLRREYTGISTAR